MIHHGDSSPEMGPDELSPEQVERLLGDPASAMVDPAAAAAFADLRAMSARTATPAVSPELASFVEIHLTTNPDPVPDPSIVAAASVAAVTEPANTVRRPSVIGQFVAFVGTIGGKICVGTTVVAASYGGAVAADVVEVPFVEDEPAHVETIEPEPEPDAVAFVDEAAIEEAEDERLADEEAEKERLEAERLEEERLAEEEARLEKERLEKERLEAERLAEEEAEKERLEAEKAEEERLEAEEAAEKEAAEAAAKEAAEKEAAEAAAKEAAEKAAEDAAAEDDGKHDEKKDDEKPEKTPEEEERQAQIAALDEALHVAKDAVRAEAAELIEPLEKELDEYVDAMEADLQAVIDEWSPIIAEKELAYENAETDEESAAAEEALGEARAAKEQAIEDVELEYAPPIEAIEEQLEAIELERDAELNRLIAEFFEAIEELEKG